MRRLVILRPERAAKASVARARAAGIDATAIPLFEVRPLAWTAPDPAEFDALLMTSANAVRHGGRQLAKLTTLPVHAVGKATAAAARAAGFTVASAGSAGVRELVAALPQGLRLLHLGGRHRREIPGTVSIAAYESAVLPAPAPIGAIGDAIVAVHSPRAGRRLVELVERKDDIAIAAISAAAAEACGPGWKRVEVADLPNDAALLALAARLCNNSEQ